MLMFPFPIDPQLGILTAPSISLKCQQIYLAVNDSSFSTQISDSECQLSPLSKMTSQTTKRLICLWKDCDGVFEHAAAFQEHVTKHGQQLNWNNHAHDTKDEKQLAIKAELNEDKDKMANRTEIDESKIVFLAIEVWVDVFGFIRRIQLARTVSLTNRHFHQICWPRLHGDKVAAHEIWGITIDSLEQMAGPSKALVLLNFKPLPIPSCPPPTYITGFDQITINFLDQQVFEFLAHISPCMAKKVTINLLNEPDKNKHALVDLLLHIIVKEASQIHLLVNMEQAMALIQSIPDLDSKMQQVSLHIRKESEIPILMEMLASPRPDGKQRVITLNSLKLAQNALEAIKKEFHASTQPVPQPFYIFIMMHPINNNIECEEQNELTNETLIISYNGNIQTNDSATYNIYRHPKWQHEQWEEDARKRLNFSGTERTTHITVYDTFTMVGL